MIHVVAIITAKPGKREEILRHARANLAAVRAEKGCLEYGPTVDVEGMGTAKFGPDTFVVIERWETVDDLKAHSVAPHMKEYGAKTRDLIASRTIHVLSPAS
jgi:quinol monooxygenase YgiN